MYRLEMYEVELDVQVEDYPALLEQNTQYFIDTVKKMGSVLSYAEVKPLYDEALTYYYGMNVDSPEAAEAIAMFGAYEQSLELIAEYTKLFADSARYLDRARSHDELFAMLSQCMFYSQYVDATYSGKGLSTEKLIEYINIYNTQLAAYNGGVDVINAEIEVAGAITSAARSNKISAVVLAIVSGYYKN
jgi:hypothetical protein